MSDKKIDDVTGISTTGHEWDGIRELDNPMPRWWLWTFYATIVWALAYTIAYPAWPLISSATNGMLGYSSRAELRTELDGAVAARADYAAAVAAAPVEDIIADEALRQFATSAGAAAFKVNCVQCHGSGAAGSAGYPNLNDDEWLWGGTPEDIRVTIAHGIRFEADGETRFSEMPAFGGMLGRDEVTALATHVKALGEGGDLSGPGAELFANNCASCHGEAGKGDITLGAPDLTDAIWLYGSTSADIAAQIRAPRHGVMPGWIDRLGETTVKELTVYVHSLGGGQ
ncbi:MAG: cytochrome-c oxidase, cbb3-type subunit III [Neoaquamicrobium sediminum]|uniref:cytochrome-c oxidase, cbb3-type subunit III n=1 Tax=Neoaquamicrobium sediminum TaxID=1849104 RepID=UPI0015639E24|nr:cytochrome-c oxidase, cbb3-type subunit III [Mesorhizobium sediminum]MBX9453973.1 cytochrome-c oxidase, cbb3-type subunit III [Mesorhizobium sp.]NRC53895.1 cytochrome-c oxidase, cbb3-type subunit III [Mesorhizobium sediminum]